LLKVRTPGNCDPAWWNGLQVLAWEKGTDRGYTAEFLRERQGPALPESRAALQQVRLRREGATSRMAPGE
jgi:hypothetical protein